MRSFIQKTLKTLLIAPLLVVGISLATPSLVSAAAGTGPSCDNTDVTSGGSIQNGANCAAPTNAATNLFGSNSIFTTITNILLFIIGAISVVMLIIGGIRYVLSGGDQSSVTSAKNTILYAIIGIVVAFLAFAAVNFVTGQLNKGTGTGYSPTSTRTVV